MVSQRKSENRESTGTSFPQPSDPDFAQAHGLTLLFDGLYGYRDLEVVPIEVFKFSLVGD